MLVATSKTSPGEIKQLQKAIAQYFEQDNPVNTSAFKDFLKDNSQSAWRTGLQLNIGLIYYHQGAFSRALITWDDAWSNGKSAEGRRASAMVDRAFAELLQLHAKLGHADEIDRLLLEAK